MNAQIRERNQAVWKYILLPFTFLTVMLLGGLRVGAAESAAGRQNFIFIAPPLVCLILAAMLMLLFTRGRLIVLPHWLSNDFPLLTNASNILTLLTVFAASAQALNSVLPERGLLLWLFSFFFLWTLWNNLFSEFDAKRLLRSLAVLFGTAFLLKHLILAAFAAPETSIWRKITGLVLEGVSLGSLDVPNFAPLTGYISFFALVLYVVGLIGLLPGAQPLPQQTAVNEEDKLRFLSNEIAELTPREQELLRQRLTRKQIDGGAILVETKSGE
jgi:hypothetical protein